MISNKGITFLISLVFWAFFANAQKTFEIVFDNMEQSEIRAAVETPDNGFLLLVHPLDYTADYIIKISSQGEIIGSFKYESTNGLLKYFGLFEHPDDDVYVLPGILYVDGATTDISIVTFDKNLNFNNETIISYSDIVHDLTPYVIPSATIYDDEIAITTHAVLGTGGFGNLYTRINLAGECLAVQTDDSYDIANAWTSSIALLNETDKRFAVLNTKIEVVGSGYGEMSLVVDVLDSTMTVINSQVLEYENTGSDYLAFSCADTPVLKQFKFNSILLNLMASRMNDGQQYYGSCLVEMNWDLDITKTTFYINDQPNIFVRLPLRNSFDMYGDYLLACAIVNYQANNPLYKTQCLVTKYDTDMNIIWRRYVNQQEGYYYPKYVIATSDGGCLLVGSSNDDSYQNMYSYVLKTDADGYLGIGENYEIEMTPFSIYPNPTRDVIHLDMSPDVNCFSLEIYYIDGRLVKYQNKYIETIDISDLNSGVYFVKLRMSNGLEFVEKIVKE